MNFFSSVTFLVMTGISCIFWIVGLAQDYFECQDIGPCGMDAYCNKAQGYDSCTCNDGFVGDGYLCDDIDECYEGTSYCDYDATCTNTPGYFTCSCNIGFAGDGFSCADINECFDDKTLCHFDATCSNTPGFYTCICNPGFTGDGIVCIDIDECNNMSPCSIHANCTNFPGGYNCTCIDGYTGNGVTCVYSSAVKPSYFFHIVTLMLFLELLVLAS